MIKILIKEAIPIEKKKKLHQTCREQTRVLISKKLEIKKEKIDVKIQPQLGKISISVNGKKQRALISLASREGG